jgi:hypothetical protein
MMSYHHAQCFAHDSGIGLKESMELLAKLPDMEQVVDEQEVEFSGQKIRVRREIRASGSIIIDLHKAQGGETASSP